MSGGLYPQGSGQHVGGEFRCSGMEKQLNSCMYTEAYTCGHHEDAGVMCPSACEDGDVRLVNFTNPYSGRVEMCYQGDWVSLYRHGWTDEEAQVICQQIGSFKEGSYEGARWMCMYMYMHIYVEMQKSFMWLGILLIYVTLDFH